MSAPPLQVVGVPLQTVGTRLQQAVDGSSYFSPYQPSTLRRRMAGLRHATEGAMTDEQLAAFVFAHPELLSRQPSMVKEAGDWLRTNMAPATVGSTQVHFGCKLLLLLLLAALSYAGCALVWLRAALHASGRHACLPTDQALVRSQVTFAVSVTLRPHPQMCALLGVQALPAEHFAALWQLSK